MDPVLNDMTEEIGFFYALATDSYEDDLYLLVIELDHETKFKSYGKMIDNKETGQILHFTADDVSGIMNELEHRIYINKNYLDDLKELIKNENLDLFPLKFVMLRNGTVKID